MEHNFISIIDEEDRPCLVNLDQIIMIQVHKEKRRFVINYIMTDNNCEEGLDIRKDNGNDNLLLMSISIDKASEIILLTDESKDPGYIGKGFVRYHYSLKQSPFCKDIACSEMFDSFDEAKKEFKRIQKKLCHKGLNIVDEVE